MDPPVDAVDEHADAVTELVGELLVDQAANDGRTHLLAMQPEAFGAPLLAAGGERPVDGLDDVAAFAERAHGRFELIRECPHPWLKLARDPIALERLQAAAERLGFDGLNITYPCKRAVLDLLDELSSDARAIGAVNTVIFKNSRRFGHNTDWSGFAESFRRSLPDVSRERIVQLGAGGAGAAVAHALLTLGAGELSIIDTERQRAVSLAEVLRARYGADRARAIEDVPTAISGADGVVNATPVGMDKFPGLPLQPSLLRPSQWVADVVYFPLETELLREAKVCGCRTMSGAGMAVFQAAEAFRLFSGEEPNRERMLLHFENM